MTNDRQYIKDDTRQRAAEDRRLVLAALEDEQAAFAQLVERYMATVYAVGWSEFHERERAEELGGELAVDARPGTGTTVRLRLPAALPAPAAEPAAKPAAVAVPRDASDVSTAPR